MTTNNDRNARNAAIIEEFRANHGKIASRPGQMLLLLNAIGAKSSLPRTNPVAWLEGEDCPYVFATKGGSPTHPDWYHNLVANPRVTVEVGTDTYEVIAEPLTGAKRDEVYAEQARLRPNFDDYQKATSRVIPVVALRRVAGSMA